MSEALKLTEGHEDRIVGAMNAFQEYANSNDLSPYEAGTAIVHIMAGFALHQTKEPHAGVEALFKYVQAVLANMESDPNFFFERIQ